MIGKVTMRPGMLSLKVVHHLYINKKGITIKDLATNIKTDYKNVHDSVGILFKEGIIKKEKIGNYNICRLNYSNENIVEYLKEYNFYVKVKGFREKYSTEYRIIMETCEQLIGKQEYFFICLIFGSYARNEEKKGSDIDLLFLHTNSSKSVNKKVLDRINAPYQKKFHVVEQNMQGFISDLEKIKELSIASEILKESPIIFYGDDIFFRIMMEASKS